MRPLFPFVLLAALTLSACSLVPGTDGGTSAQINREHLTKHWVHSREEEAQGSEVRIYRPSDYKDFPASRFRMQYVFEEDGSCDWFYLAPNDAHYFKPGTWSLSAEEAVLRVEEGGRTVFYRIVELTEELLRLVQIETAGS